MKDKLKPKDIAKWLSEANETEYTEFFAWYSMFLTDSDKFKRKSELEEDDMYFDIYSTTDFIEETLDNFVYSDEVLPDAWWKGEIEDE